MENALYNKVVQINDHLRSFGREAVQEIKMVNKENQVIGPIRYGYKPQYVFDAVNRVIGAENWRYELIKDEIYESQAVAEVQLFIRMNGEWFCKGSHKGQMQIVRGNVGDALKGAITDAIQKCLSLCSIGSDAYRGLLVTVYNGHGRTPASQPPEQIPQSPPAQTPGHSTAEIGLPQIAGVEYQQNEGQIIATGKGTFDKKDLLKSAGFRWDKTQRAWCKEVTTH